MVQRTQFYGLQTTYEQAAKLRDHGYPQPTYKAGSARGIFYEEPSEAYGPLANELIDEIRAMNEFHSFGQTRTGLWFARSISGKRVWGSSTVEALANLWCALNKRKNHRGRARPRPRKQGFVQPHKLTH